MKSFFGLFRDSAKSLRNLRTLVTTGMLLAMAVAIRSLGIEITPDIRIVFTCVPLCLIGLLYGPVVCGSSAVLLDLIGYIIDNRSARLYSPQLAAVELLTGVIYGVFLYKREISPEKRDILRVAAARLCVTVVCNICIRSYFIYTLYTNPTFTLSGFANDPAVRNAFFIWISPRVLKNLIQYPVDVLLLSVTVPAAQTAYLRVRRQFGRQRTEI